MDMAILPSEMLGIPATTQLGMVTLAIADMDRSLAFYGDGLGLHLLAHHDDVALLGDAAGTVLLALRQELGSQPQPAFSTGLYHFALVVPHRAALAQALRHYSELQLPLGSADHHVSEALYLTDPDGNGIEVYRDRPRSEWAWHDGVVGMGSDPLDVAGIMSELPATPWAGLPSPTALGHMHLRVGNTQAAEEFYHTVVGFAVTVAWRGAVFLAAGGYHHHIGLNMWQSRGAAPPPPLAAGLRFFTIHLPDYAALTAMADRFAAANVPTHLVGAVMVAHDPSRNALVFTTQPLTSVTEIQLLLTTLTTNT